MPFSIISFYCNIRPEDLGLVLNNLPEHEETGTCRRGSIDLHFGSRTCGSDAPRPYLTGPSCPLSIQEGPVTLLKFQMAPKLTLLTH